MRVFIVWPKMLTNALYKKQQYRTNRMKVLKAAVRHFLHFHEEHAGEFEEPKNVIYIG